METFQILRRDGNGLIDLVDVGAAADTGGRLAARLAADDAGHGVRPVACRGAFLACFLEQEGVRKRSIMSSVLGNKLTSDT